ncbi:DgyrCDS14849, partial [Dimorphilus gyrociliatus]
KLEEENCNKKLLHLPIFKTIDNKFISLNNKIIYFLDNSLSSDFTNDNLWKSNDNIEILDYKIYKDSYIGKFLLQDEAKLVSQVYFFEKYILKHFKNFTTEQQVQYLEKLSDCLKPELKKKKHKYDTKTLESIEFVQCLDGEYRKPSDTFSMNFSNFEKMFDFKRIPIYKNFILQKTEFYIYYKNPYFDIENLLIALGMNEIITAEICLKFCQIAAKHPKEGYDVQILQYLFDNDLSEWTDDQLEKIINYPFIYPCEVKNEYKDLSKSAECLIPIKNSYLNCHEEKYALFWIAFHMLPQITILPLTNFSILEKFRVKHKVSIADFQSNLQSLNEILRKEIEIENNCNKVKTSIEIYKYILKYLAKTKEPIENVINILQVPIFNDDYSKLVDMVKIQSLHEDQSILYDIPGYFYKRPEYLFEHQQFLHKIGLMKKINPQGLCNILSEIYKDTNQHNAPLNEKQLCAVKLIIKHLQCMIQTKKIDEIESQLYLITQGNNGNYFLKPSQQLYFIDIQLQEQFEEKLIKHNSIECFDLISSKLFFYNWIKTFWPKILSEVVEKKIENFKESQFNIQNSCVGSFWKSRLRSMPLKTALISMICQIGLENVKERYLKRLTNIEMKLVSNLNISLSFKSENHIVNSNYFIENKTKEQIVFYLNMDIKNDILENDRREQAKELADRLLFDLLEDNERVIEVLFNCLYTHNINDIPKILDNKNFTMQKCAENDSIPGQILLEGEILGLFLLKLKFEINELVIFQETTSLNSFLATNITNEQYKAIFRVCQIIEIVSIDEDNIWNNEYTIEYQPQRYIKAKGYDLFYTNTDNNKGKIEYYVMNCNKTSIERDLLSLKQFDVEVQKKCIIEIFFNWLEEKHEDKYKDKCIDMKATIYDIVLTNFTPEVIQFIEEKLEITVRERIKAQAMFKSVSRNSSSYPSPFCAKQYIELAKDDLQAVPSDYTKSRWALYKCHQACEKALKSLNFLKSSENSYSHNLRYLMPDDVSDDVREAIETINKHIYDPSNLRYTMRHQSETGETVLLIEKKTRLVVNYAEQKVESFQ